MSSRFASARNSSSTTSVTISTKSFSWIWSPPSARPSRAAMVQHATGPFSRLSLARTSTVVTSGDPPWPGRVIAIENELQCLAVRGPAATLGLVLAKLEYDR